LKVSPSFYKLGPSVLTLPAMARPSPLWGSGRPLFHTQNNTRDPRAGSQESPVIGIAFVVTAVGLKKVEGVHCCAVLDKLIYALSFH
jgi:hypothetical protein